MLTELRISNFAVIDHLSLQFSSGFQVLTGETGAGKSILIDAIALLIGERGSADQIRSDAEEAVLEAVFALPTTGPLTDQFRDLDLLEADGDEIIIRRILSRTGRHRVYINGMLTPLHLLQRLAGTLVDIHGQHEQQSLLSSQVQLDALDSFGRLHELRQEYEDHYTRWLTRRQALEKAEQTAEERRAREDLLRFQYQELAEAGLRPGEGDILESERKRLTSVRRLAQLEHEAYEALYESDTSILAGLDVVADRVRELGQIDHEAAEWTGLVDGATAQLRELAQRLRAYGQGLDEDPERLAQVEERLDRLRRLQKKYGATVETLLSYAEDLKRRLDESADEDTKTADLRTLIDQDRRRLGEFAQRLSNGRETAAVQMETRVEVELRALRMEQTRFRIAVRPRAGDSFNRTGGDDIDYLFSANQGEPLQPLARVASGGELSRTMLAIKTVLAETDAVPVLVFDEVDVGIGGPVATVMGRRLRALSTYHQVFCVTHLPQIASQANAHFLVQKTVVKKRTVTRVTYLDHEERRDEIARMLGGLMITGAARATAAEMIEEAERGRRP